MKNQEDLGSNSQHPHKIRAQFYVPVTPEVRRQTLQDQQSVSLATTVSFRSSERPYLKRVK